MIKIQEMNPSLTNKHVCVIGGTAGMGRAIASAASQAGAKVTIGGRSPEKTQKAADEIFVDGRAVDTTVEESILNFFAAVGEIDHLVVSASSVRSGPIKELPVSDAELTFRSKFFGPYLCAKHARITADGSITFFSGILSRRPALNTSVLSAVNAAVEALGRSLAFELAPIRVNTISPGLTRDTAAFDSMSPEAREQMFQAVGTRLPVGRVGIPGDLAQAALFLMTTPFVTGITLDVDGGGLLA
jgi:NAD(P)-dependent dehydrogenase (short-subunit alcohol dehydrogenase family)